MISESWYKLVTAQEPPPLLHPRMAEIYRRKVADLHAALNDEATRLEATGILRSLIDAIILGPKDSELKVELRGDLAGILNVATNERSPSGTDGLLAQVELVAGARCQQCRTLKVSRIPVLAA